MAIPAEELKIVVNPDEMTLDDLELFEDGGFKVGLFKTFMARHSNWTAKQVGALTVSELKQVAEQIAGQVKDASVPKGT